MYEYLTVHLGSLDALQSCLNHYAREGWELDQVLPAALLVVFRRRCGS